MKKFEVFGRKNLIKLDKFYLQGFQTLKFCIREKNKYQIKQIKFFKNINKISGKI